MQNFLVLGYIPGTQIQITFGLWLQFVATILLVSALYRAYRHRRGLAVFILSLYVRHIIKDQQLLITAN